MAQGGKTLPEGTDSILNEDGLDEDTGRASTIESDIASLDEEPSEQETTGTASPGSAADAFSGLFFGKFDELRAQATDRAFGFAQQGKDRATGAIDNFAKMVEEAADEIDAKVGTQYGDYARRAAQTIGGYSDAFKGKELDELFADAKTLAQKSPAVTIGAAAALGFIVARLMKASLPGSDGDAKA